MTINTLNSHHVPDFYLRPCFALGYAWPPPLLRFAPQGRTRQSNQKSTHLHFTTVPFLLSHKAVEGAYVGFGAGDQCVGVGGAGGGVIAALGEAH
ncbi:MAG: hypothetical protein FD128_2286 [Hyphomonadaceae bacterium]|nr:MAG: hypothetical protein FD128_2286 [Hyphomonadaceae bacterium]